MRYAGDKIKDNESMFGNPGRYLEDDETLPNTRNVSYPQDNLPAMDFGGEINPTELPMMRQEYMKSPSGGLSLLPNDEQGPSQGPNTPITRYGKSFMPDGRQPSGYVPGPTARL